MVTIKVQEEPKMPTFIYTDDIPFPDHNPSTDQPDMLINTNSIDGIIAVDHYTFEEGGANQDGWHKQSTYVAETAPTTIALQGAVYTKNVGAGVVQLFYRRESNGVEYQLTGPATPTINATNGFTFLPGGLILQWGKQVAASDGTIVTYPTLFTSPAFSIQISFAQNAGASSSISVGGGAMTTNAQFLIRMFGAAAIDVFWVAIGN